MEGLFAPTAPWWHYVARAAIAYFALLVLTRLAGKRTLAQLKGFDLLVAVLVGVAFAGALTGDDDSLGAALIAAATLLALHFLMTIATAQSRHVHDLVEGRPVLLGRDGLIYKDVLKAHHVAEAQVREAMRKAGCPHEDRIGFIFLESDGSLSVVTREDQHRHGPPPGVPTV